LTPIASEVGTYETGTTSDEQFSHLASTSWAFSAKPASNFGRAEQSGVPALEE